MGTLYLNKWKFNMSRVLTWIAEIVKERGGKVKRGHEAKVTTEDFNGFIDVTHTSYITFILDGVVYYFQFDDNPFFPCKYIKTPVRNGKYSRDAYLEECYVEVSCYARMSKDAAEQLLEQLVNAEMSEIHREMGRIKVPNVYDGDWHYEKVSVPERMETISEMEWY